MLTITQLHKKSYSERTRYNAVSTDATIYFATRESAGSTLTKYYAGEEKFLLVKVDSFSFQRPSNWQDRCSVIFYIGKLIRSFIKNRFKVLGRKIKLNIAGNRMAYFEDMDEKNLTSFILEVLSSSKKYVNEIFTGGQTGADMAGAVVGCVMKIPTRITFPKGYKQQTSTGNISVDRTLEDILTQIKIVMEDIWDTEISPLPKITPCTVSLKDLPANISTSSYQIS